MKEEQVTCQKTLQSPIPEQGTKPLFVVQLWSRRCPHTWVQINLWSWWEASYWSTGLSRLLLLKLRVEKMVPQSGKRNPLTLYKTEAVALLNHSCSFAGHLSHALCLTQLTAVPCLLIFIFDRGVYDRSKRPSAECTTVNRSKAVYRWCVISHL